MSNKYRLGDELSELIRDLAYMITFDFAISSSKEKLNAKTWEGLKFYTEALDSYIKYNNTQSGDYLINSYLFCKKAIECEKDYNKISNLLFNIGIAFNNDKEFLLARESFEIASKLDPENEGNFLGLGFCLHYLGKPEEALKNVEKSIKINSINCTAWYNKGCILYHLGRHEEELEAYNKAIILDINDYMAWYNRACTYAEMKQKERSLQNLMRAIELNEEYKKVAREDECFKTYSHDPDFKELIE
jgi:tetratricopeptide (TPR) repeat protein